MMSFTLDAMSLRKKNLAQTETLELLTTDTSVVNSRAPMAAHWRKQVCTWVWFSLLGFFFFFPQSIFNLQLY